MTKEVTVPGGRKFGAAQTLRLHGEKMRVVFVIHTPRDPNTAVYKVTSERANLFRDRGHEVEIISAYDFSITRKLGSRFSPIVFPIVIAHWFLRNQTKFDLAIFHSYCGWVINFLRRHMMHASPTQAATMFHGLESLYYDYQKIELARSGRKMSLRYRIVNGWWMERMLRVTCRHSGRVICLNSREYNHVSLNGWVDPELIRIVTNPFDQGFLIDRQHRPVANRLLFVGQWIERKGIRDLVAAFTQLSREMKSLELWCAGTLCSEAEVHSWFAEDVRQKVRVWPRVDRNELLSLHKSADIFVLPSLFEGFSLALAEAMASGFPIVTTPVGGVPDTLRDGGSAIFVLRQRGDHIVDAIRSLLNDVGMRERLGQEAQKSARRLQGTVLDEIADFDSMFASRRWAGAMWQESLIQPESYEPVSGLGEASGEILRSDVIAT